MKWEKIYVFPFKGLLAVAVVVVAVVVMIYDCIWTWKTYNGDKSKKNKQMLFLD